MQSPRTLALVGRPNVGKSRLFNRLARRRMAIVHDQAGVTRDVNSTEVDGYTLLDTGGIGLIVDADHQDLIAAAEEQVWFAVQAASVIAFVVDAKDGLTTLDSAIAEKLRAADKPVLLIVNKVDAREHVSDADEFAALGFGEGVPVSAEHGFNEDALRAAVDEALLPFAPPEDDDDQEARLRLALVGRPNVGKSSLINAMLDSRRLVVSEVAGTTRDSVSLDLDYTPEKANEGDDPWRFRLVDTAGLRKKQRVGSAVEFFSTTRTQRAIEDSDIVFLVIDAEEGVGKQDKTVAGQILKAGKGMGLLVNKWDLVRQRFREDPPAGYDNEFDFRESYAEAALKELFFLPGSPVLFVSAVEDPPVDNMLGAARGIWERSGQKLNTPQLNRTLTALLQRREPKIVKGRRFKAYYAAQTGTRPIRVRIFCNRATKMDDSYERYLSNGLRKAFDLAGCPLQFELRGKEMRYANDGKTKKR